MKLCLISGRKEIDCRQWRDRNDLSQILLANLDRLLTKNKVGLDKISGWKIISKVPRKWTTYRIADIALKTLKIGVLSE
ncbi:MAG TPA: hypothetical protein VK254_04620 [Candidatus Bathyarchaeia archaeon]|nr:hypothetical protein [Candidatus Bathyarchaeia archaeon]